MLLIETRGRSLGDAWSSRGLGTGGFDSDSIVLNQLFASRLKLIIRMNIYYLNNDFSGKNTFSDSDIFK